MNQLRWILLGFAVVVLVAIYLWGRRAERRTAAPDSALLRPRTEPQAFPTIDDYEEEADSEPAESGPVIREVVDAAPLDDFPPIRAEGRNRWNVEETLPLTVEDSLPIILVESEDDEDDDEPVLAIRAAPVLESVDVTLERHVPPRRPERRKIFAIRLSAAEQKFSGAKLKAAFDAEVLHHGKYDIFHRVDIDGATVFSIADISEPGHFDVATMEGNAFAGVTLFAQLPGPLPAEHAFNDMLACASRLQQAIGGKLQDERGVQLTSHRTERIREEVRGFERSLEETRASEGLTSVAANPS
jgi:cell division protein ZipA